MESRVASGQSQANSTHRENQSGGGAALSRAGNIAALGAVLSLACFSPELRAQALDGSSGPEPLPVPARTETVTPKAPEIKIVSGAELEEMIAKVVAKELARAQTNSATINQQKVLEEIAQRLSANGAKTGSIETAPAPTLIPSNAWQIAKGFHQVEEKVQKTIGWNLNTIVSGVSSTLLVGMTFWVLSMPFFRRYPNEFDIKLADLRSHRDPSEEYGVEPLFGRTEVDVLLGKPKAMSNRLLHVFLPEKWSLLRAQVTSKFCPAFSFLRFKEPAIFNAIGSFLKVNAGDRGSVKQMLRQAHRRLEEEVRKFDGEEKVGTLNPMTDGEEVLSVLTYERWNTKVNRVLAAPTKDLCTILANPARYFDQVLSHYEEVRSPVAAKQLHNEMIGFMRKLEIAVGLFERNPEMFKRYLPDHPNTWNAIAENAKALRPVVVLNTTDGICYVSRYVHEICAAKQPELLIPEIHEKRAAMLEQYSKISPAVASREIAEVTAIEEKKLKNLWLPSVMLGDRISQGLKYGLAALRWGLGRGSWDCVKPAPMEKVPYRWFGEVRMADPSPSQ